MTVYAIEYKVYFREESTQTKDYAGDLNDLDFPKWREIKKILDTVKIGEDIEYGYIEKLLYLSPDRDLNACEEIILLTTDPKTNKVNQFVTWKQAVANEGLTSTGGN